MPSPQSLLCDKSASDFWVPGPGQEASCRQSPLWSWLMAVRRNFSAQSLPQSRRLSEGLSTFTDLAKRVRHGSVISGDSDETREQTQNRLGLGCDKARSSSIDPHHSWWGPCLPSIMMVKDRYSFEYWGRGWGEYAHLSVTKERKHLLINIYPWHMMRVTRCSPHVPW